LQLLARRLGLLGRTRRSTLVHYLILCLVAGVIVWFGQLVLIREQPSLLLLWLPLRPWVGLALSLVFLWLSVRRFNDQDRPGWIALIAGALGLVVVPTGLGIAVTMPVLPMPPAIALILVVGYLIALFLPGTIGPNRYGADPRGWKSREHFDRQRRR
jgi:uncharacterized membrane protein YhaH (DUF805 family)